jgi:hypothetical protein
MLPAAAGERGLCQLVAGSMDCSGARSVRCSPVSASGCCSAAVVHEDACTAGDPGREGRRERLAVGRSVAAVSPVRRDRVADGGEHGGQERLGGLGRLTAPGRRAARQCIEAVAADSPDRSPRVCVDMGVLHLGVMSPSSLFSQSAQGAFRRRSLVRGRAGGRPARRSSGELPRRSTAGTGARSPMPPSAPASHPQLAPDVLHMRVGGPRRDTRAASDGLIGQPRAASSVSRGQ